MARLLAGLPVTERRLDLAGVSTAVVEGGDGTPLVLLHGPGEFAAGWLPVFSDLVRTNRVIARTSPATAPRQPVMLTDGTTAAYDSWSEPTEFTPRQDGSCPAERRLGR